MSFSLNISSPLLEGGKVDFRESFILLWFLTEGKVLLPKILVFVFVLHLLKLCDRWLKLNQRMYVLSFFHTSFYKLNL